MSLVKEILKWTLWVVVALLIAFIITVLACLFGVLVVKFLILLEELMA